jgi:hypothetical protein
VTLFLFVLFFYVANISVIIVVLPLCAFLFLSKDDFCINKKLGRIYFALLAYAICVFVYSLFSHDIRIVMMDAKILFILFSFYLGYRCCLALKLNWVDFLRAIYKFHIILCFYALFSNVGFGILPGNRGDLGAIIVLSFPHVFMAFRRKMLSNLQFFSLMAFALLALMVLGGRTALITFVLVFIFLIYYDTKQSDLLRLHKVKIRHAFYCMLSIVSVVGMYSVFISRLGGGGVTALENEARYIAYWILLNIIDSASLTNLFFGFGYGAVYEGFADGIPLAEDHVEQIKFSSGVDHYVSWGFHNAIVRNFLILGLLGSSIFYIWQYSFWRCLRGKHLESIYSMRALVLASLLISFSNGIYGITILGFYIFFVQGVETGLSTRLGKG